LSNPKGDDDDALDSFGKRASAEAGGPDNRGPNVRSLVPVIERPCCDTRGCVLADARVSHPDALCAPAASSTSSGANIRGREEREFIGLIVIGGGFSPGKPRLRGLSVCASPPSRESQEGAMRTKFAPFTPSAGDSATLRLAGHSARSSAKRDRRASPAVISCNQIQTILFPKTNSSQAGRPAPRASLEFYPAPSVRAFHDEYVPPRRTRSRRMRLGDVQAAVEPREESDW